tara:strand:+ start:334 stop:579 length:246 start_codon:yes stop_codon:yes gene_type:complete
MVDAGKVISCGEVKARKGCEPFEGIGVALAVKSEAEKRLARIENDKQRGIGASVVSSGAGDPWVWAREQEAWGADCEFAPL